MNLASVVDGRSPLLVRAPSSRGVVERATVRIVLQGCLLAGLLAAATTFVCWYHSEPDCGASLYRDPVTGRVASFTGPGRERKALLACRGGAFAATRLDGVASSELRH